MYVHIVCIIWNVLNERRIPEAWKRTHSKWKFNGLFVVMFMSMTEYSHKMNVYFMHYCEKWVTTVETLWDIAFSGWTDGRTDNSEIIVGNGLRMRIVDSIGFLLAIECIWGKGYGILRTMYCDISVITLYVIILFSLLMEAASYLSTFIIKAMKVINFEIIIEKWAATLKFWKRIFIAQAILKRF